MGGVICAIWVVAVVGYRILRNEFKDSFSAALRLSSGSSQGLIADNFFTNWSADTGSLKASAIWVLGDETCKNVQITRNRFLNTGLCPSHFCIESYPDAGKFHPGFVITENLMDGAGIRGTGVSGFFINSTISKNVLLNGKQNDTGAWAGWRNGLELFGSQLTVCGNVIENGSIVLDKGASSPSAGVGNVVTDNAIKITSSDSTGIAPIQFSDQDDLVVSRNTI